MENYIIIDKNVRYKKDENALKSSYIFEVYKKPFLFGLLGKRKWVYTLTTTDFDLGLNYSKNLIFR